MRANQSPAVVSLCRGLRSVALVTVLFALVMAFGPDMVAVAGGWFARLVEVFAAVPSFLRNLL